MKLLLNALTKYLLGFVMLALLLFLPAGTVKWPQAWLFLGLLFIPMLGLGIVLYIRDPQLLQKRLNGREKEKAQKSVIAASGLAFVATFVLAGLDVRFDWSQMPGWVTAAASVLLLASYGLYAEVMRENTWLSRTIEVQSGQKLVDSGLYGVVRHPMYAVTILLFLSIPLVLGSWPALAVMLVYPAVIVGRIRNEEAVLERGLEGYAAYRQKVRYRLLPFIW